jgi:hypothetical protein
MKRRTCGAINSLALGLQCDTCRKRKQSGDEMREMHKGKQNEDEIREMRTRGWDVSIFSFFEIHIFKTKYLNKPLYM